MTTNCRRIFQTYLSIICFKMTINTCQDSLWGKNSLENDGLCDSSLPSPSSIVRENSSTFDFSADGLLAFAVLFLDT